MTPSLSPKLTVDGVEFFNIPGREGYVISKCGKVRSLSRVVVKKDGYTYHLKGRPIRHVITSWGYPAASLGRGSRIAIHRLLGLVFLGLQPDQQIDHINRDKSNFSLSNLRICSASENSRNKPLRSDNTHGSRGVEMMRRKTGVLWRAKIWHKRKCIHIGIFESKSEAASAYNAFAAKLHGEFATLN